MSLDISKFSSYSTFGIKRKFIKKEKWNNLLFSCKTNLKKLQFSSAHFDSSSPHIIPISLFPSFCSLSTSSSGALWQHSINPGSFPTRASADTYYIWTQIPMCTHAPKHSNMHMLLNINAPTRTLTHNHDKHGRFGKRFDPSSALQNFMFILLPHSSAGRMKTLKWKAILTFTCCTNFSAAMEVSAINGYAKCCCVDRCVQHGEVSCSHGQRVCSILKNFTSF